MLENEINLLADKLGMTVSQIYQMNLQYQQFVVIQNTMMVIVGIMTFAIFMVICYYMSKTHPIYAEEWIVIFGLMMGTITSLTLSMLTLTVFNSIILPMQYPEYAAMVQTMNQIQSFIP